MFRDNPDSQTVKSPYKCQVINGNKASKTLESDDLFSGVEKGTVVKQLPEKTFF